MTKLSIQALCVYLALASALSLPSVACAQERDNPALERLESEIDLLADDAKRERLGRGLAGLAVAGISLPTGIVLQHRKSDLVQLTGVGLIVGGAVALVPVVSAAFSSEVERLRVSHRERKAKGMAPDALVIEAEKEWEKMARNESSARRISGSIHLAIGAALVPVGLTLLFRDHVGDWSELRQLKISTSLLGVGLGWLAFGTDLLVAKGDARRAWDQHVKARGERGLASTRIDFAPVANGGVLSAHGSF
ncbi:MAG TPA: hypothetical protein VG963_13315 [Polyangiaceae bacterium]|nr:hypothetical protein [Polyangiaceae bacterium]